MNVITNVKLIITLMFALCSYKIMANIDLTGPQFGPVAQKSKSILFLSQDKKNGGISTIYRHFQLAGAYLKWQIKYENGKDNLDKIKSIMLNKTLGYDALVLGGISLTSVKDEVKLLKQRGIIVLGWHAIAEPGSTDELYINIATHTEDVARMAVEFIKQDDTKPLGIIVLTDQRFEVANAKTDKMIAYIQECIHCELLQVVDVNLSKAKELIPTLVPELNNQYGLRWTHTLAINDNYFDSINTPLKKIEREDIRNIAAGDGSFLAIHRLKNNLSYQVATVSEPFAQQGWQLADELNRAFAGVEPSHFVAQPITLTHEKLRGSSEELSFAEFRNYKKRYMSIWFGREH